ncbi:hypothetical protein SISNIDRAFT_517951 [Sistotremastrum niveocremeum HHB9708]|uniref:JmjC domain-containing protein n=1 Tax=Sistotremastrum niveocremeum HHB9708 TaxID=1314777 RepID=A0A164S3L4_9AGAM|nr:hypothetical protein SISNIDRAFT_517951 [Sistotremastrum niveocremeum HHB9708]
MSAGSPPGLRPSLEKLLLCAPIANTGWRSSSQIFRPVFWSSRSPDQSFAAAVYEYLEPLDIAPGDRLMLTELAAQADALETLVDKDPRLAAEICYTRPGHSMYPLEQTRQVFNLYMLCVLLDRLLWSLDESATSFPPKWHRPDSATDRALFFDAYEDLIKIMDSFLVDLAASRSSSDPQSAPESLAHISATFYEHYATHGGNATLEAVKSNFMYWCGTAVVAVKNFQPAEFDKVMNVIRTQAPHELRNKLDRELHRPKFRGLMPFWTVVAHSPIVLFSPKFFRVPEIKQHSTIPDWMKHVGFPHQFSHKAVQIEHSIWGAIRRILGGGYTSVDNQCNAELVTNFHIAKNLIFEPVAVAAKMVGLRDPALFTPSQELWPFNAVPLVQPSLPAATTSPPPRIPTPSLPRLASTPTSDNQQTLMQIVHAQVAPDLPQPTKRKASSSRKNAESKRNKKDIASTAVPDSHFSSLPPYAYNELVEIESTTKHTIASWLPVDDSSERVLDEFIVHAATTSRADHRNLEVILALSRADNCQDSVLAPQYITVYYTRGEDDDLAKKPLTHIIKDLSFHSPTEEAPQLGPQLCLEHGINLCLVSDLHAHSSHAPTHSTTIGKFVSTPLSHRRTMYLKAIDMPLGNIQVPPIVRAFFFTSIYSESAFDGCTSSPAGLATWIRSAYGSIIVATITQTVTDPTYITPTHTFRYNTESWSYDILRAGDVYVLPPGAMYCIYALTDSVVHGGYFYSWTDLSRSLQSDIVDHVRQLPVSRRLHQAAEMLRHSLVQSLLAILRVQNASIDVETWELLVLPDPNFIAVLCAWTRILVIIIPKLSPAACALPDIKQDRTLAHQAVLTFADYPQYRNISGPIRDILDSVQQMFSLTETEQTSNLLPHPCWLICVLADRSPLHHKWAPVPSINHTIETTPPPLDLKLPNSLNIIFLNPLTLTTLSATCEILSRSGSVILSKHLSFLQRLTPPRLSTLPFDVSVGALLNVAGHSVSVKHLASTSSALYPRVPSFSAPGSFIAAATNPISNSQKNPCAPEYIPGNVLSSRHARPDGRTFSENAVKSGVAGNILRLCPFAQNILILSFLGISVLGPLCSVRYYVKWSRASSICVAKQRIIFKSSSSSWTPSQNITVVVAMPSRPQNKRKRLTRVDSSDGSKDGEPVRNEKAGGAVHSDEDDDVVLLDAPPIPKASSSRGKGKGKENRTAQPATGAKRQPLKEKSAALPAQKDSAELAPQPLSEAELETLATILLSLEASRAQSRQVLFDARERLVVAGQRFGFPKLDDDTMMISEDESGAN